MRHLLALAEKEDSIDLDFDIFEPSMSAFAELFNEKEKMQVTEDIEDKKWLILIRKYAKYVL